MDTTHFIFRQTELSPLAFWGSVPYSGEVLRDKGSRLLAFYFYKGGLVHIGFYSDTRAFITAGT